MTMSAALETIWLNGKYAARGLRKSPGFTMTVVVVLALGIAANTAMFSIVHAVLLKPLMYPDSDRVVVITGGATPSHFDLVAAENRSYTEVGAYAVGFERMALSGAGEPEMLKGARVSANFLHILDIDPALGRSFLAEEDKPGAPLVAMISAELWQRRFGGSRSVIGKPVTLAGEAYTIVGVLPPSFQFPLAGSDVWVPRPAEWSVIGPQSRPLSPTLRVFALEAGGNSGAGERGTGGRERTLRRG